MKRKNKRTGPGILVPNFKARHLCFASNLLDYSPKINARIRYTRVSVPHPWPTLPHICSLSNVGPLTFRRRVAGVEREGRAGCRKISRTSQNDERKWLAWRWSYSPEIDGVVLIMTRRKSTFGATALSGHSTIFRSLCTPRDKIRRDATRRRKKEKISGRGQVLVVGKHAWQVCAGRHACFGPRGCERGIESGKCECGVSIGGLRCLVLRGYRMDEAGYSLLVGA